MGHPTLFVVNTVAVKKIPLEKINAFKTMCKLLECSNCVITTGASQRANICKEYEK
jgi:hypothetical protein